MGPQSRGPLGTSLGEEWGGQARAPPSQSPRPFPGLPRFFLLKVPPPTEREGKRSSFSLNPKSRAGASSRDLRGRLQITHNSSSFLSTPAFQDGESVFCSSCRFGCLSSIRRHPPRGATARGCLHCPERGHPAGSRSAGVLLPAFVWQGGMMIRGEQRRSAGLGDGRGRGGGGASPFLRGPLRGSRPARCLLSPLLFGACRSPKRGPAVPVAGKGRRRGFADPPRSCR